MLLKHYWIYKLRLKYFFYAYTLPDLCNVKVESLHGDGSHMMNIFNKYYPKHLFNHSSYKIFIAKRKIIMIDLGIIFKEFFRMMLDDVTKGHSWVLTDLKNKKVGMIRLDDRKRLKLKRKMGFSIGNRGREMWLTMYLYKSFRTKNNVNYCMDIKRPSVKAEIERLNKECKLY